MKYFASLTFCLLLSLYACRTRTVKVKSSIYNTTLELQTKRYPISVFKGKIKDIYSSEVIPYAIVDLRDKDGVNRGAVTDTAGNFLIEDLPFGNYILDVTTDGYQDATYEFNINEHAYYNCEIKLKRIKIEEAN
jgi:uncharacterized protein YlxP (DUF503 family)